MAQSRRLSPVRLIPLAAIPLLAGLLTLACGDPTGPKPPPRITLDRDLSPAEQQVAKASNDFAIDLIRTVAANDTATNIFLSPLSASMALGMTMNGAAANTWAQMRDALGFAGMEEADINAAYHDLTGLLLALDPNVELGIGNAIWAREGIPFYDDFVERVRASFGAEARELDFADPGAKDAMNAWVAEATHDRIRDLVDYLDPNAIMYLFNAVYFNGEWRLRFDPDRTAPAVFTKSDGGTVTVDMMDGKVAKRTFYDDGGTIGVELPYGGDAFAAVAVLPPADQSIRDFVAGLDSATWADWMAQLDAEAAAEAASHDPDAEGTKLRFPKLELTYDRLLNPDLAGLGMTDMFDTIQADFTRLTPLDLPAGQGPPWVFVSRVKQKTFLKVDERGTEAAAATVVEVVGETAALPTVITFDRPFLFAIRERLTGTLLFIGIIGDPSV